MRGRRLTTAAAGAALAAGAVIAIAVAAPSPDPSAGTSPASAASGPSTTAAPAPRTRFRLPVGELRLSDASVAAGVRAPITFTVRLDRRVPAGRLALTLPRRWTQRSGVSAIAFARLPARGRSSSPRARVTRSGRVVTFGFSGAKPGDAGSYRMRDLGIPAGLYRLAYSWRGASGRIVARGSARVVFRARPRPG